MRRGLLQTLLLVACLALLMLAGLGLWAWISFTQLDAAARPDALKTLANAGLALAFGGVLGGLVGLIFAEFSRLRDARLAREDFIRNILSDIKSVIDLVETARLLIDSHKSAKTYGEQMRRLPDAIMILRNIQRALRPGFRDLQLELTLPLETCIGFLDALLDEYRACYKEVSRLQSIDEEIERQLRQAIATDVLNRLPEPEETYVRALRDELAAAAPPDDTPRYLSNAAWRRIETFPRLALLRRRDGGEALDAEFLAPMDLAGYALRARLPGGRRRERNEAMENRLAETVKAAERILTDRESASATH